MGRSLLTCLTDLIQLANASQTCGGGGRNSIWSIATSGIVKQSTTVQGYKGCYSPGNFTTNAAYTTGRDSTMSGTLCQRTCRNKGFVFAGVNDGDTCYCSNTQDVGQVYPLTSCVTACAGDSTQSCGNGQYQISIYDTQVSAALPPSGFPSGYIGCFSDPSNAKQMTGFKQIGAASMSSAICGSLCRSKGFSLAGTENSNQCYCGDALPTTLMTDTSCSSSCTGTPDETCGGVDRLSVYNVTAVKVVSSSTVASVSTRSASATGSSISSRLTTAGTTLSRSSTGTASSFTMATTARTTLSGTASISRMTSGTAMLSARSATTGSSTRAPLPTGNFVVVDGSTCEANDIGTRAYVPEEEASLSESQAQEVRIHDRRHPEEQGRAGSFGKKRGGVASRFRKVSRSQRRSGAYH